VRPGSSDGGGALIEALLVGVVLMIPLVWLLAVLAQLHNGALAAAAAAREAGADAARARDAASAAAAVDAAVTRAFVDQGLNPASVRTRWSVPSGFERGGIVEVEVSYRVAVGGLPVLGTAFRQSIPVTARHVARMDPYRSR
jgi:hypothetical protein